MTEEERIFKGGLYASEEPELVEKKRKAHKLSQDYNTLYEEEQEAREKNLQELLDAVGRHLYAWPHSFSLWVPHTDWKPLLYEL